MLGSSTQNKKLIYDKDEQTNHASSSLLADSDEINSVENAHERDEQLGDFTFNIFSNIYTPSFSVYLEKQTFLTITVMLVFKSMNILQSKLLKFFINY